MKSSLKKIIWIILGSVLVVSVLSALIQSRRGKNLQQEVADLRRELRAQGFKTEFADFNVTNDPATQARAAALRVFENELKLNADNDQLDFLPRGSDHSASVVWKQDALTLESSILDWPYLHGLLDTNRELLDVACAAAMSGPIRFDVNFRETGNHFGPAELALRNLSLSVSDRVILELHDGDPNAAWSDLLAATRFATAWEPGMSRLSHLIHSRLVEVAFDDSWQALQYTPWPDEKLSVLQQEWASANFFTNIPEGIAMTGLFNVNHCQRLSQRQAFHGFSPAGFASEAIRQPASAFSELKAQVNTLRYRSASALNDEKNLLLYFHDRELEARHALQSSNWAEMRAQSGITNAMEFISISHELTESMRSYQQDGYVMLAFAARAEAQRRIVVTAIALERYRGKHGAYPATLPALTPEFLKTVPLDFMDGQPLRYRLTDDEHFVLYSVGLDCVDDGGKQALPGAPRMPRDSKGNFLTPMNVDIVWPRPATP